MLADVTADSYFTAAGTGIMFTGSNPITFDLNGFEVNRGLTAAITNGYVIYVSVNADVTINGNGTITGGCNAVDGGGIINGGDANLTISYTTISNNSAESGGAIFNHGYMAIDNCIITDNSATSDGGGILNSLDMVIDNCIITNNSATLGGGIYAEGTSTKINDCTINQNTATDNGGGVYVYMIYEEDITVITGETYVTNNHADGNDDNVFINYDLWDGVYTFTNISFEAANSFIGEIGVTLADVSLHETIATTWNAVHTGTITSDDSNYAVKFDGTNVTLIEFTPVAEVTVDDTTTGYATFADALAAVNSTGGTLKLLSDIDQSTWADFATTAIVFNGTSPITFDLNGFEVNRGLTTAQTSGYVIFVSEGANVVIKSSASTKGTITGGNNSGNGGGISNWGTLALENILITGNNANYGGGVNVSHTNGSLTVTNCEITNNNATSGAGIYNNEKTVKLINSSITGNTATQNGGGVKNHLGTVAIIGSSITNNTALINGAGVSNNGTLTIGGSTTVTGNTESTNNKANNIFLWSGKNIEFAGTAPFTGEIGVTLAVSTDNISDTFNNVTDPDAIITSDDDSFIVDSADDGTGSLKVPVVEVTVGGTTKGYATFADALAKVNANGGTLKLLADVTNDSYFTAAGDAINFNHSGITLDLNGFEINRVVDNFGYVINVNSGANVIIKNGTIKGGNVPYTCDCIYNSGTLTLNNVVVEDQTSSGSYGVYNEGSLTLTGSTNAIVNIASGKTIAFDAFTGSIQVVMADSTGLVSTTGDEIATSASVSSYSSEYDLIINGAKVYIGTAVAQVDGENYATFADALAEVNANGGTLKLLKDITDKNYFTAAGTGIVFNCTSPIVFDLNGFEVDRGLTAETASSIGYVICVNTGDVIITSTNGTGTITGGYNTTDGGGIYNNGNLKLNNLIIKNNVSRCGGGIYGASGSSLTLIDCTIQNNTSTEYNGGGIFSWSDITIYGNTTITGNTKETDTNNCRLANKKKLIFDNSDLFTGNIGVSMASNTGELSTTWDAVHTGTITSDNANYGIEFGETTVSIVNRYTVTFDSNGGSAVTSVSVNTGKYISAPADPTRNGYTFEGWFNGTTEFDFANTAITANITLTAKWEVVTYTITYDVIDGTVTENLNPTTFKVTSSEITLVAPTVTGCTFLGWYDGDGNEVTTIAAGSYENVTLTAKYSISSTTESTATYTYTGSELTYDVAESKLYTVTGNKATTAGTYTVTIALKDNCKWADGTTGDITYTFTINKATYDMSAVEWTDNTLTYNATAQSVTLTGLPTGVTVTYSGNSATNVGDYTATATLSYDTVNYNTISVDDCDWSIAKASVAAVWNVSNYIYNGQPQVPTATATGLGTDTLTLVVTGAETNAGDYTATATLANNNYTLTNTTKAFSIDKATYDMSAVEWSENALTYNAVAQSVKLTGLPTGVTVTYSGNSATNVGDYTATATLSYDKANYNTISADDCDWSIAKASVAAVWNVTNYIYNASAQVPTATATGLGSDTLTLTVTGEGTNAGDYTATATLANNNYTLTNTTKAFSIDKATYDMSAVEWTDNTLTYNATAQSVKLAGLPTDVTATYANNSATNVGDYTATATLSYDTANYNTISVDECDWSISKASVAAVWNATNYIYNGQPQVPTATATGLGSDTLALVVTGEGTNAGDYTATATLANNNYTLTNTTKAFSINKATYDMSAVEWTDNTLTYNATAQSVTLTGLPTDVTATYANNSATNVGDYTATATLSYDTVNYNTISVDDCDWSIAKAELAVDWNATNYIYNGQPQVPTATATGLGTDTLTLVVTGAETNAGDYTATATLANDNYTLTNTTKAFSIDKATYDMTAVEWSENELTYNATAQSVKLAGLPTDVTATYANNSATNIGNYTATATLSYDTVNYNTISVDDCSWSIAKASVAVDWTAGSYIYNGQPQVPTATATGLGSDTLTLSVTGAGTNAGDYTATATLANDNYTLTNTTKAFSIVKATYDMSAVEWTDNTLTYNATAQSVTLTGLPTDVTATYSDNSATNVGDYTATATLSYDTANYNTISVDDCDWSIAKASVAAVWNVTNYIYNASAQVPTATAKGKGSDTLTLVVTGEGTNAGDYTATATLANDNYTLTGATQDFTINKATYDMSAVEWSENALTYNATAQSVTLTGLPTGVTVTYSGNSATNVGNYTATATLSYDTANYNTISVDDCDWSIDKATTTAVWSATNYIYNGSAQVPTATATGLGSDTLTLSVTGEGTNAGDYTATATLANDNYTLTGATQDFTIDKATATVVWNVTNYIYNGSAQAPTATAKGKGSDTLTLVVTGEGVNAGDYTANAKLNNDNYYLTNASQSYTIDKATYNMDGIAFNNVVVDFDKETHSAEITGALPNGVTVTYSGNGVSEVGVYVVTATFSGDTTNYYAIADKTATIVVNEVETSMWWAIVLLSMAAIGEMIVLVGKKKLSKGVSDMTNYSFAPLAFVLVVPVGELIAMYALAAACIIMGIILAINARRKKAKREETQPTEEVVEATAEITEPAVVEEVTEAVEEAVAETVEPVAEDVEEPIETVTEEVVEEQADVIAETVAEEVVEEVVEPIAEEVEAETTVVEEVTEAVEEAVAEEIVEEAMEPVVEETVAEPVAEEVVATETETQVERVLVPLSTPKTASDDEEAFAGVDAITGKAIIIRYNKSFTAKLIQSSDTLKGYYETIKNALLSYKGVKSRISWKYDAFGKGRTKIAKLSVRGKSLYMYLALNAEDYAGTKYSVTTANAKTYESTPCLYKVNGPRKLIYALQLIADLAEKNGLAQGETQTADYYKPFETTQALLEQKLIKEVTTKKKYEQYMEALASLKPEESDRVISTSELETIAEVHEIRKQVSATEAHTLMTAEEATELVEEATIEESFECNFNGGKGNAIINIDTLSKVFADGDVVTLAELKKHKLVSKKASSVKVLARGILDKKLTVVANDYSIDAVKMIALTGGHAKKLSETK